MRRGRRARILLHLHMCVFIIAVPITTLFADNGSVFMCVFYYCRTYFKAVRVGGGGEWRTCAMRDDEPRPVWMSLPITHWLLLQDLRECVYCVCVLLLQDLLQSCARGGRRRVEDMCYERRRAEACVDESAHHALFITAVPLQSLE
jgi:hypothetical protein